MFEPKTTHPNLRIHSFHILDTSVDTEATKITDSIYTVSWSFVKLSSRFVRFRSNLAEATWRSYCCNHFLGSIDQFEINLDRLSPTVSSSPSRHPSQGIPLQGIPLKDRRLEGTVPLARRLRRAWIYLPGRPLDMQHALASRNYIWPVIQKYGVPGFAWNLKQKIQNVWDSVERCRLIMMALDARPRSFLRSFFVN